MNSVGYSVTLGPQLRDDEALVVENAIRLAVDSIVNVLFGVNSARAREYHRIVSDRDKEIQRLEARLTETEDELGVLRRLGCSCGGSLAQRSPSTGEQSGETGCGDSEVPTEQQHCEMTVTVGLCSGPPPPNSPPSMECVLQSSHSPNQEEDSGTSHSFQASGRTCVRNVAPPSGSLVVKEEPHDFNSFYIKWETPDDGEQETPENVQSTSVAATTESGERSTFDQRPPVDVQALRMTPSEQIRVVESWTAKRRKQEEEEEEKEVALAWVEGVGVSEGSRRPPRAPYKMDPDCRLDDTLGRHSLETLPPTGKKSKPRKKCRVCLRRGRRRETRLWCVTCHVPLHSGECFQSYHTEENYSLN